VVMELMVLLIEWMVLLMRNSC